VGAVEKKSSNLDGLALLLWQSCGDSTFTAVICPCGRDRFQPKRTLRPNLGNRNPVNMLCNMKLTGMCMNKPVDPEIDKREKNYAGDAPVRGISPA
jgi:hypothetical protein